VTGVGGMLPRYPTSHRTGRSAALACICAIVPAEATTRAPIRKKTVVLGRWLVDEDLVGEVRRRMGDRAWP
jgi:hypothetical protein